MPATATAAAAVTVAATANSDADVTSPGKGGIDGITGGGELLVMGAIYRDGTSGGISGWSDYRVHRSADGGLHWELVEVVYSGSASYSGMAALNATHVGAMIDTGTVHATSMECGAVTQFVEVCVRC